MCPVLEKILNKIVRHYYVCMSQFKNKVKKMEAKGRLRKNNS